MNGKKSARCLLKRAIKEEDYFGAAANLRGIFGICIVTFR
jgi:hypothetical protein